MNKIRDNYARIETSLEPKYIKDMLNEYKDSIEIKPSSIHGDGVFATRDIKKGAIFHSWDDKFFSKMNDLAYDNNLDSYLSEENLDQNINVAILVNRNEANAIAMMFGYQYDPSMAGHYFIALKDISKGDELSRIYGYDFWEIQAFFDKFPNNKYRETGKDEDLPSEWVFIDTIRPGIQFNFNMDLYGKKIDDKYYYAYGFCGSKKVNPPLDKLTDASKEDNSIYKEYEAFGTKHHGCPCSRTKYLDKHKDAYHETMMDIVYKAANDQEIK